MPVTPLDRPSVNDKPSDAEALKASAEPGSTAQKSLGWAWWILRKVSRNRLLFWIDLFFQLRERGAGAIAIERSYRAGEIDSAERTRRLAGEEGRWRATSSAGKSGFMAA